MAYQILHALPAHTQNSKRKPGPRLCLADQLYSIKHPNKDTILWRCVDRSCPGTARTGLDYSNAVAGKPHTMHIPDVCIYDILCV